jgi:hypothetical protein
MVIHNGFNDSCYAYCDRCGRAALIDLIPFLYGGAEPKPVDGSGSHAAVIGSHFERAMRPCPCGGHFRRGAAPRCPTCSAEVSPEQFGDTLKRGLWSYSPQPARSGAREFVRDSLWQGIYCILFENCLEDWYELPALE